ncbi:MAG: GNAT family N-acetyltransferase [Candidatus Nanoarchaeia archaeon]|nr:GNAT family N-acetyltransferase [Candidatus Nanoarchaeia archaeon]MDD5239550.1 GNAT family N-acetyltransferase [Candidatus Nanoarchaeia archaeon]
MIIRKATQKDAKAIVNLMNDLVKHHSSFNDVYYDTNELAKNWKTIYLKKVKTKIRSKKTIVLVAEENGKVVGYVDGSLKPRFLFNKNLTLDIDNISIAEGYRGKGIGTKLMKAIFKIGKKRKAFCAWLGVRAQNKKGRKFYKKLGFKDSMINVVKKLR